MPFLSDYISAARFLVVAPLLILSDLITKPWRLKVASQIVSEHIAANDVARYNNLTLRIFHLRDAVSIQLILVLIAVASSALWVHLVLSVHITNWQVASSANQAILSSAGQWHTFISQPLFRFVLLDWFLDYALWTFFLFKVSRFSLRISATHPDGAGGLSFIAVGQSPFCVAAFALSTATCSVVAQTILETQAPLQSFANLGLLFLAVILVLFLGPLLVFTPLLVNTKRQAIFSYGALCHQLDAGFASKWIAKKPPEEPLSELELEPATLAAVNTSFEHVQNMRAFIFGKQSLVVFITVACLPAFPLAASVIPLKELLKQLLKALM
jgi:hypothetical protein